MLSIRVLLVATGAALLGTGVQAKSPEYIPDQYICVFKPSVSRGNVVAEARRAAQSQGGRILHTYGHSISGFAIHLPATALNAMKSASGLIDYCEQDQVVTASAGAMAGKGKPTPTPTPTPSQSTPWGVAAVHGGTSASTHVAWVIDSGIDLDHPDLNVNVAASISFVRDSSPNDGYGHGTHVAGTIAACDNGFGVVGVAPCSVVVAVRVLDRTGRGTASGAIAGINYVAANGAQDDVANLSLGGGPSDALDAAVKAAAAKGIKFAIAAGNSSIDAATVSPARAEGPNIYTISAFDADGKFASFSNWGNPPIDYAEPGVAIPSTYKDGGYATSSGTSMAAPHMAGILLLGSVGNGGTVSGDPDGKPDIIGVH